MLTCSANVEKVLKREGHWLKYPLRSHDSVLFFEAADWCTLNCEIPVEKHDSTKLPKI